MSLGYAEKLSYIEDVGKVGMAEFFDSSNVLQEKSKPLPEASLPFHRVTPGMTHMALVELEKAGILKFLISQENWRVERIEIFLKLNFSGCGCLYTQIASSQCFKHDKDAIFQKLKDNAVQDSCSGQTEVIERKVTLAPRTETTVYAIVTNIKAFDYHSSNGDVKLQKESLNGTRTSQKRSRKHKPRS